MLGEIVSPKKWR